MSFILFAKILFGLCLLNVQCTEYFKDKFDGGNHDQWVPTQDTGKEYGKMILTPGKYYGDKEEANGIQTSQDARFYATTAMFNKAFSNKDKSLVIQYQIKHEQNIDCGGGYVKIAPSTVDSKTFHGESPYNIMFGPDICGPGTKKVHVIFSHFDEKENKLKNYLTKKDIPCKDDALSHVYTLIVRPNNTFVVKIDGKKVEEGSLEEDFDILPPKKIKDPEATKPGDWVDKAMTDDSTDTKPENWDQPEKIADKDATKPENWDDEMDGDWEPPKIDNPDFKGEWKPKQINNPDFKGPWVHPMIDNPDYKPNPNLYAFEDNGMIAIDIWQVKSGTVFDNFIVTDDEAEAEKLLAETWEINHAGEKKMKEAADDEEAAKMKEESKKSQDSKDDIDEEDDEDAEDDKGEDDKDDEEAHDEL